MHLDASVTHDLREGKMTETHTGQRLDGGVNLQIHLVAGIEETEIDLGPMEHEPERAVRVSSESEEDDDAVLGQFVDPHHSSQRPHEEVGIEMLVGEILAGPPIAPDAERIDHCTQLAAGDGEAVLVAVTIPYRELLDNAGSQQRVQPPRQEISRHPRDATLDVAEPSTAHEQFAQDERRPTLGEDLRAECNGTELS